MSVDSEKTGQSIDILKEEVIIPEVSALIQAQLPEGSLNVRCMDIGTGDASSFLALQNDLEVNGICCKSSAFVDCSTRVFPRILENTVVQKPVHGNIYVCQPNRSFDLGPQLSFYENSADFITAQMLFHQIENDSELSLLLCKVFLALKENGCMYITDFNPEYIKFLVKNEPSKFLQTESKSEDRVEGIYTFDSGGSIPIVSREIVTLASMLLVNGFCMTKMIHPSLERVKGIKSRYQALVEENLPMFDILKVEKREERFVSYTSGFVKKIKTNKEGMMKIILKDNESVIVNKTNRYKEIKSGDEIILFEVLLPDERNFCQFWVVPKGEGSKIWSTSFMGEKPKG